jgi:thymidylate kinase
MKVVMRGKPRSAGSQGEILWISVDGVECAGKTSLCGLLQSAVRKSQLLPEFSSSPVGEYLKHTVESSPHFISRSIVGQSLLFLADYAEIAYSSVEMDDLDIGVIFQDRGFLSKLVYQLVVLEEGMDERRARKLMFAIMDELPQPDVTILLDASMSVIESRLNLARPGWLTAERRIFVERASAMFRDEVDRLRGVTLHMHQEPQDTAEDVLAVVLSRLESLF